MRALFDDAVISSPTSAARRAVLDRAAAVLGQEVALDLAEGLELECSDTREEA